MACFIFLDFDGVLHPDPCHKSHFFGQLPLIEAVLRAHPDIRVIVSSSWRFDHALEELRSVFSSEVRKIVVGVTPTVSRSNDEGWIPRDLLHHHREWECRKWLRENHVEGAHWLAVDDVAEWFTPDCPNLLVTQSGLGFQPNQVPHLDRMIGERSTVLASGESSSTVRA